MEDKKPVVKKRDEMIIITHQVKKRKNAHSREEDLVSELTELCLSARPNDHKSQPCFSSLTPKPLAL